MQLLGLDRSMALAKKAYNRYRYLHALEAHSQAYHDALDELLAENAGPGGMDGLLAIHDG
jgi:hypothetical protein